MRNNAPFVAQDKILYSVPMLQKRHGTARTAETSGTHNDCHDNALSSAGIAGTRHSRYHDFGTLLNILCMYDTDMDLHICVSLYPHNPVYHVPPKPYFVRYIYIHFLTTQKMLQTLILSTFEALF